jgi:hypothetical protein
MEKALVFGASRTAGLVARGRVVLVFKMGCVLLRHYV